MSRRGLISLHLALACLVLAYAALQLMLLVSNAQAGGDSDEISTGQQPTAAHHGAVARLEEEWGRVNWELGRRPPPLDDHESW